MSYYMCILQAWQYLKQQKLAQVTKENEKNLVIQETLKDTKVKNTKKEQLTLFIVYIIYYEIYFLNLWPTFIIMIILEVHVL